MRNELRGFAALSLGMLVAALVHGSPVAALDDTSTDTPTPTDTPPAPTTTETTKSFTVEGSGTVTQNPDGSKTITDTWSRTNDQTGKTASGSDTINVEKTSDGREWTRDSQFTGPNGGTGSSETTGSSHRNGDGTGNWNSTTNGNFTNAKGKETDWTTNRTGSWEKTSTGLDWQKSAVTSTSNGVNIDRETTGSATKTSNGYTWESNTKGTATGPNGKTESWNTDREGSVVNNGNGTKTVNEEITRTNSKGGETTIDKTGTLVKEGDGKWEYEGSKTETHTPAPKPATNTNTTANTTSKTDSKTETKSDTTKTDRTAELAKRREEFKGRFEDFQKRFENFRKNGGTQADREELRGHFAELTKHFEALHKDGGSGEMAGKFEELRKRFQDADGDGKPDRGEGARGDGPGPREGAGRPAMRKR